MPLLDLQTRFRELGRIRMGKKQGNRPVKLDTWRLTSPSERLLQVAAEIYGGKVQPWKDAPVDETFELVTETNRLPILIPPGQVLSQWYELWSGGGCKKRCDGIRQVLVDRACSCPKDIAERMAKAQNGQACSPATRLSVMVKGIPDLGVWRLETHGYNAAQELDRAIEILQTATVTGNLLPAVLRIENRKAKRDGKTKAYMVPVIEIEATLPEMIEIARQGSDPAPTLQIPPVERKALPGESPPVSTDPGQPEAVAESGGRARSIESASLPGDPPPVEVEVPEWVRELPGSEEEVLEAARVIVKEEGLSVPIWTLPNLDGMPPHLRAKLLKRLIGEEANA